MNTILAVSKISSKRLLTLPVSVYEKLELKPDEKIAWILERERIYVTKA